MEQAPNTEKLDDYLQEVVQALHGAVNWGRSHQNDPKLVDKAIQDSKEILDVIMEGRVSEWLN
jgi:hypothetical protein